MRQFRIRAALAALMTVTALLTACAGKESSGAGTTPADTTLTAEESTAGSGEETGTLTESGENGADSSKTTADSTAAGTVQSGTAGTTSARSTEPAVSGVTEYASVPASGEGKEAYDALIRFLDACKAGDTAAILSSSNLGAAEGLPNAPDVKAAAKELKMDSYTVGRCAENKVIAEQYREYRDEAMSKLQALSGEERQQAELLMKMLPEVDRVWVFEVENTFSAAKTVKNPMYVMRTGGKWQVDLSILSAMSGYVGKSKIVSANSSAKQVMKAFNTALTDADAEDTVSVMQLDGRYSFKGSDFSGLTNPASVTDRKTLLQRVKFNVQKYFPKITDLTAMEVELKDGVVEAVAVAQGDMTDGVTGRKILVYGTAPKAMLKEKLEEHLTIGQALEYAKSH
ncbi:MAG: hypothetical protein II723_04090 [Oscillospiraceae bacterium]|nr:hypothetical protein [Oscillospiraceae bacterium]